MHAYAQNGIDYAPICHNSAELEELTPHTIGENRAPRDRSGQKTVGWKNWKPSYKRYVSNGIKKYNSLKPKS